MRLFCLIVPLALLAGCGPSHYGVTGVVTLDDAPLAGALVSFLPESDEAMPVIVMTDDAGRYWLPVGSEDGLPRGTYTVRITTFEEGNPDDDPPIERVPERVPVQYNIDTTLQVKVKPGENSFDFPLESHGVIVQPQ